MKNIQIYLLSFIGLLATYAIAFGLDRWIEFLRDQNSRGGIPTSMYLFLSTWAVANIILAICVFSLYTWALPKLERWAVWAIVILSLLISLIPVIYWLPLGTPTLYLTMFLTNRAYMVSVGGWIAVAGIFTLLKPKRTD